MDEIEFPVLMEEPETTMLLSGSWVHLQGTRNIIRALIVRANLHEGEGRIDEAIDDLLMGLRLGNKFAEGSLSLSYSLAATASNSSCLEAFERMLSRGGFTPKKLQYLQDELIKMRPNLPDVRNVIEKDQIITLNVMENFIVGDSYLMMIPFNFLPIEEDDKVAESFVRGRVFRILTPDRSIRSEATQYFDEAREATKVPHWEFEGVPIPKPLDEAKPYNFPYGVVRITYSAIGQGYDHDGAFYAKIDGVIQSIAVLRFKAERGEFPDGLHALVPEYLQKLPADPFTGAPFIYLVKDDGFIIYSIGINRRDDGGRTRRDVRGAADVVVRIGFN